MYTDALSIEMPSFDPREAFQIKTLRQEGPLPALRRNSRRHKTRLSRLTHTTYSVAPCLRWNSSNLKSPGILDPWLEPYDSPFTFWGSTLQDENSQTSLQFLWLISGFHRFFLV
ncbi:hypothetical protein CC2G_000520 [Coprinopsis cinerea AmutBmut pab1-1]|nr:hypothetical protein CC2G_000520 [Coprinopsis cinerea AmutBmut pab1-1]